MRVALLALVTVAGCAAEPDWNAAAQQALADGQASLAAVGGRPPPPAPREPARIRPLRTASLPVAAMPAARLFPAEAPGADSQVHSASALGGSPPESLVAMLGEPALRRAEGPVSIWLYTAAGCQLDVMFYPSAEGPRIAYIQARAGGFAQRTEAACLRELAAQARRRPQPDPRQGGKQGGNQGGNSGINSFGRRPATEPVG